MSEHSKLREHGIRQHSERIHEINREHPDARQDKALITKEVARGIHEHEKKDHPGKPETKLHLRSGGHAEGHKGRRRLDRASGGRAGMHGRGKGSHVNVIVAPGQGPSRPVPVPVPAAGGMGSAGAPMPPRPPMGPPMAGGAPGGMPGGGPPMGGRPMVPMAARGGRMGRRRWRDTGGEVEAGEAHGQTTERGMPEEGAHSALGRMHRSKMKVESARAAGD